MMSILLAVQINCLAEAIFAEARGEPYAGQVLVGGVIKNRVLDSRFENDFCKVIEQPWQFSFVHEVSEHQLQASITEEEEAWERAQNVAYSVVNSGEEPLFNNILYYHSTSIKPAWDYSKIREFDTIGRHSFYTDK